MNADSRLWAALAVAGALAGAGLAAASGWWPLLWAAVPLGLGGLLVLLLRVYGALGSPEPAAGTSRTDAGSSGAEPPLQPFPDDPPAPRRTHLAKSPLASSHPEYDVLLSAVVCWRTDYAGDPGYAGRAATLVLQRAAEIAAAAAPQDCELTRHRLAAELGREVRAEPEGIAVWAEEVRLELHDDDAARLQRIRDFRKDEEIREHERAAERSFRRYLRDDMLADPGQAVLWWLARDPEQIHDTVGEIGTLSRLSAAAVGTEVPPLYRDLAGAGPAPLSDTAGDAEPEPGGPHAPPPGFPDDLFGAGANGHGPGDGAGGRGTGPLPGHGAGTTATGGDPRDFAEAIADRLAGTGGDESRDRLHVAADLFAEAGQTELAKLLRVGGGSAAEPADGAEGDGGDAARGYADTDGVPPTAAGGAGGTAPTGGADGRSEPRFADWAADAEGTVTSQGSTRAGGAGAPDPAYGADRGRPARNGGPGADAGGEGPDGARPLG